MSNLEGVTRRRLASSPRLHAIVKSPPGQFVVQTARAARLVTRPGRFVLRQALPGSGPRGYRLRTGGRIEIRHRTRDVAILHEIFGARNDYAPPPGLNGHLDGPISVLDLGGNIGLFGVYALGRWDVRSLCSYEPDPANAQSLRATAAHEPRWTVRGEAAAAAPGTMRFLAGAYSESRAAEPGEAAIDVPVVDVLAGPPCDLMKIDIEGGEWAILADPRLAHHARVIVLEWHSRGCPEPDARAAAGRLLARAGFVHQHEASAEHAYNGVLWAWREPPTPA